MRIAPSGRSSREAREPDQPVHLVASQPALSRQNRQNLGRLGCLRSYLSVYLGQGMCGHFAHEPKQPEDSRQVCQHQ